MCCLAIDKLLNLVILHGFFPALRSLQELKLSLHSPNSPCVFLSGFFVVPVFVLKCQQASPGRAVGALADGSLTPTIGVTSVGTGATMPMTATALAREVVAAAGEGIVCFGYGLI